MIAEGFYAWIKTVDGFEDISVAHGVAPDVPSSEPETAASAGIDIEESMPAMAYGGDVVYRRGRAIVNIYGRRLAKVRGLTRALGNAFMNFTNTDSVLNILAQDIETDGETVYSGVRVITAKAGPQSYFNETDSDIEHSQSVFEIEYI